MGNLRKMAIRSHASPVVSVIIPAMNERRTIGRVIREAYRVHPQTEVIVVVNGSKDGTEKIAARAGARLVVMKEALGHDVGRSIGAHHATGNVLLFSDADIVIPSKKLKPLVHAVLDGCDVALNGYEGPKSRVDVHSVVLAKHALNIALGRGDLGGASLTTIPHAMSRKALETIGFAELCVPPKAHALAILAGLQIRTVPPIDVGRPNPVRRRRARRKDPLETLIVGDHVEAMERLLAALGPRGPYPDESRLISMVR